jgi:hypothetical protein
MPKESFVVISEGLEDLHEALSIAWDQANVALARFAKVLPYSELEPSLLVFSEESFPDAEVLVCSLSAESAARAAQQWLTSTEYPPSPTSLPLRRGWRVFAHQAPTARGGTRCLAAVQPCWLFA